MGILSADTSFEAEAVQMEILRRLGPVARLEQLAEATELSWHLAGIAASESQRLERWLGRLYPTLEAKGLEILKPIATPLAAASRLESLGIPYVIGGSYASSIHGEPRSTRDCDFLVELGPSQIDLLIREFEAEFYVSRQAVAEAVQMKRSFNLIHLKSGFYPLDARDHLAFRPQAAPLPIRLHPCGAQIALLCSAPRGKAESTSKQPGARILRRSHASSGFKINLFVSQDRDYDRERLSRGMTLEVQGCKIRISSAEDTVLSKLEWYSLSPTDQQWRDILGVLLVQSGNLDRGYLKHWAKDLKLDTLLSKAFEAVEKPS